MSAVNKAESVSLVQMHSEGYSSLCVCLLGHNLPLGHLFILKMLSCAQWEMKVKTCRVFSETASLQSYGTSCIVRPFSHYEICACASKMPHRPCHVDCFSSLQVM